MTSTNRFINVAATLPSFNAFHPLGRNGQPTDVVNALLVLASEEAVWSTGTVLSVDGGGQDIK